MVNAISMYINGRYGWEEAKSNRSFCRKCGEKIIKGERRLVEYGTYTDGKRWFFCEKCAKHKIMGGILKPIIILFEKSEDNLHNFIEELKTDIALEGLK